MKNTLNTKKFSKFLQDTRGVVAVIFGICAIPVIILVGAAVDQARGISARNEAATALDAALVAAVKVYMLNPDAEIAFFQQKADEFFDAHSSLTADNEITYTHFEIWKGNPDNPRYDDFPEGERSLIGEVKGSIKSTFTSLAGFNEVTFSVRSSATYDMNFLEVGMMLDVTKSMKGSKFSDLKEAGEIFLETIFLGQDELPNVRVGLAPFATYVNAGQYAEDVTGESDSPDDCVSERDSEKYTDASPGSGRWLEPRDEDSDKDCPPSSSSVLALTNQKQDLIDHIQDLEKSPGTAGHLGVAWAWYLISPEWNSIWGFSGDEEIALYKDKDEDEDEDKSTLTLKDLRTQKAVILMTDGNFNTDYTDEESKDQASKLCKNMKERGVTIYTVGFKLEPDDAEVLENCASSPEHHYLAEDGDELTVVYREIAMKLATIRLTD